VFPDATSSANKTLELTDDQRTALGKALGRKIEAKSYPYLEITGPHGPLGVVFVLDVIGQTQPITFAVGIADGAIRDLEVVVYREPHGEEISDRRFRKQFVGKRAEDPIALGKDIDAISGATISSRSATFAARKALDLAKLLPGR
jgi:Na+-translocating ferredoxin:NAD+ oxidoreductase RnfG subunit